MPIGTALQLPRSGRLACWLRALRDGGASLDDALDGVRAGDAAHHVLSETGDLEPLALALGRMNRERPTRVHVALPVPGDLTGLAGPREFNVEAVHATECVVLTGIGRGLVPDVTGAGVVWRPYRANDPPPYDLPETHRTLRRALSVGADTLTDLDLARWSPEAADLLLNLRAPLRLPLPPGTDPVAAATASTAIRCRAIVAAALEAADSAVTAAEADQRRAALQPLAVASRLAVAAACSTP